MNENCPHGNPWPTSRPDFPARTLISQLCAVPEVCLKSQRVQYLGAYLDDKRTDDMTARQ